MLTDVTFHSTIALMTPVSGFVYDGKSSISRSNGVRCVIHGRVSIWPSSISPMIRRSRRQRIARGEASSSRGGGTADRGSSPASVTMPTNTSRPVSATYSKRAAHRLRAARRVEHDRVKRAVGQLVHTP